MPWWRLIWTEIWRPSARNGEELPLAKRDQIGRTVDHVAGRNRYIGYLISLGIYSFKGVKVGLDCANGASWNIAKCVFDALGAKTYVINAAARRLQHQPERRFHPH